MIFTIRMYILSSPFFFYSFAMANEKARFLKEVDEVEKWWKVRDFVQFRFHSPKLSRLCRALGSDVLCVHTVPLMWSRSEGA